MFHFSFLKQADANDILPRHSAIMVEFMEPHRNLTAQCMARMLDTGVTQAPLIAVDNDLDCGFLRLTAVAAKCSELGGDSSIAAWETHRNCAAELQYLVRIHIAIKCAGVIMV